MTFRQKRVRDNFITGGTMLMGVVLHSFLF
nr:MAG TPA: hypothetical protein [Caudoviricetes sp.]